MKLLGQTGSWLSLSSPIHKTACAHGPESLQIKFAQRSVVSSVAESWCGGEQDVTVLSEVIGGESEYANISDLILNYHCIFQLCSWLSTRRAVVCTDSQK